MARRRRSAPDTLHTERLSVPEDCRSCDAGERAQELAERLAQFIESRAETVNIWVRNAVDGHAEDREYEPQMSFGQEDAVQSRTPQGIRAILWVARGWMVDVCFRGPAAEVAEAVGVFREERIMPYGKTPDEVALPPR